MSFEECKKLISDAEMVLVGIGEDFSQRQFLKEQEAYGAICNKIADSHAEWLVPYADYLFLKENGKLLQAYQSLEILLKDKNYFVLSTCMDGLIRETGLKQERIVEPCGTYTKLQCIDGCGDNISETAPEYLDKVKACLQQGKLPEQAENITCSKCGKVMIFNNLYAEKYDEAGYQKDWSLYTKWLQGTLNRKLCILELGSGMMFSNVLRFRFEKIAGLNQKASLIRVHKNLYQLPEEVSGRGLGIAMDAVDFMAEMPGVC